jgi:hypothetical protein
MAMLKVLFFGCLRSGELCALDIKDYDLDDLTLRLRETKNNSDAITFLNEDFAKALNQYLAKKPPLEVDNRSPLVITDFGDRWQPNDAYKMFMYYKDKSGISKILSVLSAVAEHPSFILRVCSSIAVGAVICDIGANGQDFSSEPETELGNYASVWVQRRIHSTRRMATEAMDTAAST